ncbi:alpha-galactosidase [Pseudarthrobacter oxydans]|uniref:alpha-galactosidase n=1 Tax=Pseudarthrobacter oxydans TaxID=1671 RepID=UPI00381FE5AA
MTTDPDSFLARTPPMGWNSWDCFGSTVTESEVIENAEFMAEHLAPYGWDTVVVDIQWYEADAGLNDYQAVSDPELDNWGRQMPAPNRFPSAAEGAGFKPLADRVHALGLKFGIHIMRGIPRKAVELDLPILGSAETAAQIAVRADVCEWNPDNFGLDMAKPGAQAYYDSQAEQFASWGVDFVKLDDALMPPVKTDEISGYHRAIERTGRDIVLSLSPGRKLSFAYAEFFAENSEMWRISDDLWDSWPQVLEMFQRIARWAPRQRPGAWGDADMLPLGRVGIRAHVGSSRDSNLTLEEQRTMMSLWSIARSPLMIGGHLPESLPETVALFQNAELIEILQRSKDNREIIRDHDLVVWQASHSEKPTQYRAVFWLGDHSATAISSYLADLGLGEYQFATDVWSGKRLDIVDGNLVLDIPAHGVRLLSFG